MEEIPLCSNCKRVKREACDFIGDDGKQKKTCKKCRDKGKKYKKTQEQIDKKNEKSREKKYYQKYRERKRNENEEDYLKRNSENAKKWRDENKEYLSKYRSNNINKRIRDIKLGASRREIYWDISMTDEICKNMICLECSYCGFISLDKLNGIDRVDNTKGYSVSNCVSCCYDCNKMKGTLDYITFINRCKHISFIFNGNGELHQESWPITKSITYKGYKNRALKKNLDFDITKEYYDNLVCDNCYYCENENDTGLDRVCNNTGYIMSNVVSCCSECNYMKFDMRIDDFIVHCSKVCEYSINNNLLKTVEPCLRSMIKRNIKEEETTKETYVMKTTLERNTIKKEINVKDVEATSSIYIPEILDNSQEQDASNPEKEEKTKEKKILIFSKLSDDIIIHIMTKKGKQTTQEVSDYLRNTYNILLQRHEISKLYTGIFIPSECVQNSEEYKNAMEKTTKRVYNKPKSERWKESIKEANFKRKLTDEDIIQIMNEKKTAYSAKELGEKYNVSRMTIDNVWTGKMLPKNKDLLTREYQELLNYKRTRKKT